jgi:hypothetical protein
MPWKKGEGSRPYGGGGRSGYELEQEQLALMRYIVSKDLNVVKKFYDGKATEKDFKILNALQVRVGKYLDKLHASKEKTEIGLDESFVFLID